jgi:hypothetical protein
MPGYFLAGTPAPPFGALGGGSIGATPPEAPSLLGTAVALIEQTGLGLNELAKASGIPAPKIAGIVLAGSETRPKIQLDASREIQLAASRAADQDRGS